MRAIKLYVNADVQNQWESSSYVNLLASNPNNKNYEHRKNKEKTDIFAMDNYNLVAEDLFACYKIISYIYCNVYSFPSGGSTIYLSVKRGSSWLAESSWGNSSWIWRQQTAPYLFTQSDINNLQLKLRAKTGNGAEAAGVEVKQASIDLYLLDPPTNINVSLGGSPLKYTVTWTQEQDADRYIIQRKYGGLWWPVTNNATGNSYSYYWYGNPTDQVRMRSVVERGMTDAFSKYRYSNTL